MAETPIERAAFRQRHKFWFAQATEIVRPATRLFRRIAAGSPSSDPRQWRNLALIGADHIGDVLCRTVALDRLKTGLPLCHLHFVASRPAAELLETHPALDSVIVARKPLEARSIADRVALLRSRPLDAVLCYDTSDYWKDQLAVAVAGIGNCVGYTHKGFRGLATRSLPFRFPEPYAESFRASVSSLVDAAVAQDLRPVVHLTDEDRAAARQIWTQYSSRDSVPLAVGLTGNQPHGEPLKERMLETIVSLVKHHPVMPVFLGTQEDRTEIDERCRRHGLAGINLCGKLCVRKSIALLKDMRAAFVVDSGLRHMANAAGIPVVYFRNLYTFKIETGSYLPTEHDLAPNIECLSREVLATKPPLFEIDRGLAALHVALGITDAIREGN